MKIFYIEIDKFKKIHSKEFLDSYADIEIKTEKRFYEYTIGRYLIKETAKRYYNRNNVQIIVNKDGKPVFNNSDLYFSLSHSKNIIIACFDKFPCGIDIEYMKERNLEKLSEHFNRNFSSQEDFYKFWTTKEASFKLNNDCAKLYHSVFNSSYFLCVASANDFSCQSIQNFESEFDNTNN